MSDTWTTTGFNGFSRGTCGHAGRLILRSCMCLEAFSKPPLGGVVLAALLHVFTLSSDVGAESVTILVHGWDADGTAWQWAAASQAAVAPEGNHGTITVLRAADALAASCSSWDVALASSSSGDIAVRVDWSAVADHLFSRVSAQEVAAVVAPLIYQGQNHASPLCELPIHLIGHSRGGGMICEIARLLGEQGIDVDHMTLLDPHPLTSSDPQLPLLRPVTDTPVSVYENVLFADNYWQSRSYPRGERVSGAYNRLWTDLPGGYHDSANSLYRVVADHLNIHLLYLGTIDTAASVSDGMAALGTAERVAWYNEYETEGGVGGQRAGFYYSRSRRPGERLQDQSPVPGGDSIRAGYHQDELLGGAGARQPLEWEEAVWPNLLEFDVSLAGRPASAADTALTRGDTLNLRYVYRDYDSGCTVSVHLDQDRNPYNHNSLATIATRSHDSPTGTAVREFKVAALVPALAANGPTYLYVEITDGFRTRYLYASCSFVADDVSGCAADFDGNGQVDFADFFLFADQFGGSVPDVDPRFDLNADGMVDMEDFFLFADSFGQ